MHRVGLLAPSEGGSPPSRPEFWERLAELGYVEGENLAKEVRGADVADSAQLDARFQDLAGELVRMPVDVIVVTARSIRAAMAATSSIPIVIMSLAISDPVADGFVDSLARPGKNVTGAVGPPPEMDLKRLQLLVEALPTVSKVAVLSREEDLPDATWISTARALGVELMSLPDPTRAGFETAFEQAREAGADALLTRPGLGTTVQSQLIANLAERYRLPGVYPNRAHVVAGGLMAYETSLSELYRRGADAVDRILRGADAAELPVELPKQYDLIINLRTARLLGLTLSPAFLSQADELIE